MLPILQVAAYSKGIKLHTGGCVGHLMPPPCSATVYITIFIQFSFKHNTKDLMYLSTIKPKTCLINQRFRFVTMHRKNPPVSKLLPFQFAAERCDVHIKSHTGVFDSLRLNPLIAATSLDR